MNGSFILQIAILAIFVKEGLTVRCYNCNSDTQPGCEEPGKEDSGITAEVCRPNKLSGSSGNWLEDLTKLDFFEGSSTLSIPMVCQKIVATQDGGKRQIYRSCQLHGGNTNPCTIYDSKAQKNNIKIEHCSICEEDMCNGAQKQINILNVCGITLIILGVSNWDEAEDFSVITGNNTPKYLLIFLTMLGILFIILRLIGFAGFCFQKRCLLWTYAIVSLTVSILLILVSLTVKNQIESFASMGYTEMIKYFLKHHQDNVIHEIQEKYGCCGALSPSYWIELPESCCLHQRCDILSSLLIGCAPSFYELVRLKGSVIMWTCIGVSAAGCFGRKDMALKELASNVIASIGAEIRRNQDTFDLDLDMALIIIEINCYLEKLGATSVIYEDLLKLILKLDSIDAAIRFSCLQMLLNEGVQSLTTENFPFAYYERILQVIAAQGHGLRMLNLTGVWVKDDHMHYLHDILKNLPNLVTLLVPYIGTDELLTWIAKFNPRLKILNVSGESDITETGIEALAFSLAKETLTVVDIGSLGEENIANEDIAILLLNLPNLTNLKSYSFVGRSLKYICEGTNPTFKCKLKYLHDTQTSATTLEHIIKTCPMLEDLYLDTPDRGILSKITTLKLFKLKLYKFDCSELYQVLDQIGTHLYHITLIKGRGTMEIGKLISACPALIDLDLYMMDMLSYSSEKCFNRLQGLEILSSPLQLWSLKYFICNTPTLKRLAIDSVPFTDEDMTRIFLEHDFKYLEDIWFTEAQNLTLATCEILIDRCPQLQSIGQLTGWRLTPDDVILLKGILKSCNSNYFKNILSFDRSFHFKWRNRKKRQAQRDHNWKQVAECSNKLGALYSDCGDYESAITQFKDEFTAYKSLGMKMQAGHAERMIGEMLMYQAEYDSALKFAQNYLKTAVEERNQVEQQRAYATIARIHLVHGQSEEEESKRHRIINLAQKAFLEAALLCKSIEKQIGRYQAADMEARVYLNLGVCKEYCDEFSSAIDYMQKAIQIAKKFDLHELLFQCYVSAGLMYSLKIADTGKALLMFNLAQQTAERLTDKTKKICEVLQYKADVSLKIGDIQSAKQPLVQAFKLRCSENDLRASIEKTLKVLIAVERAQDQLLNSDSQEYECQKRLYEIMGDGWCQLGNFERAIEYYLKMLGCAELTGEPERDLIPIYISLYQTYKDNKNFDLALDYMQKEHELVKNNPKEAFDTLMNIADVQELAGKNFFDLEETYRDAMKAANAIDDKINLKRVFFKLLQLTRKHGMVLNEEELEKEITEQIGMSVEELESTFETNSEETPSSADEPDIPDIGHDINLDELFPSTPHKDHQSRGNRSFDADRPSTTRKRTGLSLQTKRNQKGETPLHIACISGNLALVKQLLDQGHETIVRDNAGWIPLHEACNHGYKEIVEELLSRGNNRGINDRGGTKCDGVTPLYDACCNGNLEIVELLLDRGADPTMKTNDGDSTLNALELWYDTAKHDLTRAEETLYRTLHEKIKHSLEKTGNLDKSKPIERRRSRSVIDIEVKSNSSSERTPHSRNIRHGLDISSSDDDSETGSLVPYSKPTSSLTVEKKRARSDYKDVMTKLRKPHSTTISSPIHHTSDRKQSALITSESNIRGDDWLEDDLGPKVKKQKILPEVFTTSHTKNTSVRHYSPSPVKKKSVSQEIDSTSNSLTDCWEITDPFGLDDINDVPIWQSNSTQLSSNYKKSPKNVTSTFKRQKSLLSSGFTRSQSPKNVSLDNIPDSTMNEILPVITNVASKVPDKIMGLKTIIVKISDELISMPVKTGEIDNLDIGWLSSEVKRRYLNLFGRCPEIRITLDNALVENSDPLAMVFTASEIGARILKFQTISITDRYRTICEEMKKDPIEEVTTALELSVSSKKLILTDLMLRADEMLPLTIVMKQENELESINLENNWIGNDGARHLSESLKEMRNLEELNLVGNCIECTGLKMILGGNIFDNLHCLILDFNPLGDEGLRILLEKGENSFKNLTKLSVAGCDINELRDNGNFLQKLSYFDISENQLNQKSLDVIANNVNRDTIQVLKLNNISGTTAFNWNKLFQNPFKALTELHLAQNCGLTDTNVSELLSTCICLNLLDLSHNLSLTSTSFEFFINNDMKCTYMVPQKIYLNGCQKLLPSPSCINTKKIRNNKTTTTTNISLPEYMELTLNITNPTEQKEQEMYVRRIWDDCYNNDDSTVSNNTYDDDADDEITRKNANLRRKRSKIGCVKVNKFHLTAFVLDTND
uniref:CSON005624 protein n=1 Tax=Culicoides sonorensis TaxID=179676 RepID=A0A336LVF7_CULSO